MQAGTNHLFVFDNNWFIKQIQIYLEK